MPISNPFPDVAYHVRRAAPTGAAWIAPHRGSQGMAVVIVGGPAILLGAVDVTGVQSRAVKVVPPGIDSRLWSARCVLPLGLGGQAASGPVAVVAGGLPGDADHRMVHRGLFMPFFQFSGIHWSARQGSSFTESESISRRPKLRSESPQPNSRPSAGRDSDRPCG
jgi:hypothetical protein